MEISALCIVASQMIMAELHYLHDEEWPHWLYGP